MRLIDTRTGALSDYPGRNIPRYAILSHTWAENEEEVSFAAMTTSPRTESKGYHKIEMLRELANQQGIGYAWIDTCCIDKTSSSELSEAINSMYKWYQRAHVCYVYLSDLPPGANMETNLSRCRWFRRGWTLQELIAPKKMLFFDQEWNKIGSKETLINVLPTITRISSDVLLGKQTLSSVSIAQRMCWAAHRHTTRVEDMAYCLLGIFGVHMPLLYGEEEKAFLRLQEAIIQSTADLSVFAWQWPQLFAQDAVSKGQIYSGVLAESPQYFYGCMGFEQLPSHRPIEMSASNNGIKIRTRQLLRPFSDRDGFEYILPLYCRRQNRLFGLALRKCGSDQFVRVMPWALAEYQTELCSTATQEFYLWTSLLEVVPLVGTDLRGLIGQTRSHGLKIEHSPGFEILRVWPSERFDTEDQMFFVFGDSKYDYCGLKFRVDLRIQHNGRELDVYHECIFYALGWSGRETRHLQCTLVEYKSSTTQLDKVRSYIARFDPFRKHVLEELSSKQIPRKDATVFKVESFGVGVKVFFKLLPAQDLNLCQNTFWRVKFEHEVYRSRDIPDIAEEPWHSERRLDLN